MNIFILPEFCTTSSNPSIAGGGRCGCRSGGPAGDGGGDRGGHCHHCGGDEEEKQGLHTAAVVRGSCIHECCVQW